MEKPRFDSAVFSLAWPVRIPLIVFAFHANQKADLLEEMGRWKR